MSVAHPTHAHALVRVLFHAPPPHIPQVMQSVGVMMLGAAIAAWKDLTFDPVSYFYLFLTNLFTRWVYLPLLDGVLIGSGARGKMMSLSVFVVREFALAARPIDASHHHHHRHDHVPLQSCLPFCFPPNRTTDCSLYTVYINVVAKDTGLKQFAMLYYRWVVGEVGERRLVWARMRQTVRA